MLPGFLAPLTYGVAVRTSPHSLAVGDFDGDGSPDLVVANFYQTVSVLLGNTDGTFRPAVSYFVGNDPGSVAVGDFDADGTDDIAVASFSSNNVCVLLANGDGTFQRAVNYGIGFAGPVAVGDFNGDGLPDLAVAHDAGFGDPGGVSVLLGNGDGSFQAVRNFYTYVSHTVSMAVGDFNNDGTLDLAVAGRYCGDYGCNDPEVDVLLGNGDGTFQDPRSYTTGLREVQSVAVGDFDGNGILDLAVVPDSDAQTGTVRVLLGNGDGSFQAARNFAAGRRPFAVAVGDFNGDGTPDLAVANYNGSNVSVLLGNGDGSFQPAQNFRAGSLPVSVAVADFNGDGWPDLAVVNYASPSGHASILLNDGNWTGPRPGPGGGESGHRSEPAVVAIPTGFGAVSPTPPSTLRGRTDTTGIDSVRFSSSANFAPLLAAPAGTDAVAVVLSDRRRRPGPSRPTKSADVGPAVWGPEALLPPRAIAW
jgi:hypothetical protein